MNSPESLRGSAPEPTLAYGALTYSGSHAAQPRRTVSARSPPRASAERREGNESSPPWLGAQFVGQEVWRAYANSVASGSIFRRHRTRELSFRLDSGVCG